MISQTEENELKNSKMLNGNPNNNHNDSHHQEVSPAFSIATPALTNILPISESISDTSFMLPSVSYHQEEMSIQPHQRPQEDYTTARGIGKQVITDSGVVTNQNKRPLEQEKSIPNESQATTLDSAKTSQDSDKPAKKRSKTGKKNSKLDAKSKLEKSRQSARECRARKKLRYQYLEDLVSNREKAVVKLREELSVFCELSKQIDLGSLSDSGRSLIVDQTKENTHHEGL